MNYKNFIRYEITFTHFLIQRNLCIEINHRLHYLVGVR